MKRFAVELTIDFADIDSYVEKIDQLLQMMYAFLPSFSHTSILSEQEIMKWKQLLLQINETSNAIWRYVTRMRSELYEKLFWIVKTFDITHLCNKSTHGYQSDSLYF